ncbi:MAG TPA: V-type ATP synthase subunit D [Candidatus Brocadiia bacterium]|nr:V-type ATP synthase subunit D [Candidatus Brocadiia bacterium]
MQIRVNPNRMELLRLSRRLKTASRGHKLLKDKLEGLIQEFVAQIETYRQSREEIDRELPRILRLFVLARLTGSEAAVYNALMQSRTTMNLAIEEKRLMGVTIPEFKMTIAKPESGYSYLETPPELDEAVATLREFLPRLLAMAAQEEAIRRLMEEIERTRRRVNALEYVMIPQLKGTIKVIRQKLEELERGNITRLMKIKEMRMKR